MNSPLQHDDERCVLCVEFARAGESVLLWLKNDFLKYTLDNVPRFMGPFNYTIKARDLIPRNG